MWPVMSNPVLFSHLCMLGIFALACTFQVDILSFFFLSMYMMSLHSLLLTLDTATFTLVLAVTVQPFLSSWLLPFYLHVSYFKVGGFSLFHSNAVLFYSSVVLPGLRKDIVCSCTDNDFLVFFFPNAFSKFIKDGTRNYSN